MSRIHAARAGDALEAFDWMAGWAGGWMPVERRRDAGHARMWWHHCGQADSGRVLAETVRGLDERWSPEIRLGLPQSRRWNGGVGAVTVLWAVVEGSDQVARAQRFRPRPSMVVRAGVGSRRWLLWALDRPAGYFDVQAANRRLAYALHATQKHGDPDGLSLPAPGSCLRVGRARPVPVVVSRLSVETFALRAVVGRLKEPPPRDAWLQGQLAR